MINLLIPVCAVLFAFVISVLYDLRTYKRFDWSRLRDHSTKAAMYLAAIGMLEVVDKQEPNLAPQVIKFSFAFAGAEVLGTIGMIQQAVRSSNSSPDALTTALREANPFDIATKK